MGKVVNHLAEMRHEYPYQKSLYDSMKSEYPALADYDMLLKQRGYKTGYYKEEIDKHLRILAKNLNKKETLIAQLQKHIPHVAKHILAHMNELQKERDHER